jgi:hypothetical protein
MHQKQSEDNMADGNLLRDFNLVQAGSLILQAFPKWGVDLLD